MKIHRHETLGYYYYDAPESEVLDTHYKDKYFQDSDIYSHQYTSEEIRYFLECSYRKIYLIQSSRGLVDLQGLDVLEIGVGEGWGLAALVESGAHVTGVDYTTAPCESHNPHVCKNLLVGRPDRIVTDLNRNKAAFDVIWMDNVLEHVPSPEQFLRSLRKLMKHDGQLLIEVPNDFSPLQEFAFKKKLISKQFWLAYPDHLSYFSAESLNALLESEGFGTEELICDFPIDIFLLNERTNYVCEPEVGKTVHRARLLAEELVSDQPRAAVIAFYRSLANIGLGRNLINLSRINRQNDYE